VGNIDGPSASFAGPASICAGDDATFTFTGSVSGTTTFNWNFGSAGTLNSEGPHTVLWAITGVQTVTLTLTDENGCTDTFTQTVTVSSLSLTAAVTPTVVGQGESVQLSASAVSGATGSITYEWTAGSGTIACASCANTTATPGADTTLYVITATDSFGCSATATVSVTMIYAKEVLIPNAFSPNGDGENDVFRLTGRNIATFELYIYDRWGNEMFAMEDINLNKGWDGTHRGTDCELGVYVYYALVTFTDGTEQLFKGNVTLVR
jgi:gliding motility-associated-like protein